MGHANDSLYTRPVQWRGPKALHPIVNFDNSNEGFDDRSKVKRQPIDDVTQPGLILLAVIASLFCLVVLPSGFGAADDNEFLHRITKQGLLEKTLPSPALRGCCGEPADFRWVFLDDMYEAIAGQPFRTRLVVRDAQGRQARPSACDSLRVGLGFSGRAHLSRATAPKAWRRSQLELDIEDEQAEVVQAEMRIESQDPSADVLLHTSPIRFGAGPVHSFTLKVEPSPETPHIPMSSTGAWMTRMSLDVIAVAKDRFGNPAFLDEGSLSGGHLVLESNALPGQLELRPQSGILSFTHTEEARAVIRSTRPGELEVWLKQVGGNITVQKQRELRDSTIHHLLFEAIDAEPVISNTRSTAPLADQDLKWKEQAEAVKDAFLHAWRGYRKHAWGYDELQCLSRAGRNNFGGVGLTILDSLTTLWIMGFKEEFQQAEQFVRDDLDFETADSAVSLFELTIRGLGGLLGAHTLTGRKVFLDKAKDLGERLLPAFKTPSRMPLPRINIARRTASDSVEPTILSEVGSLQLEFRSLSARTRDKRFQEAADGTFKAIVSTGVTGLLPVYLTNPNVVPVQGVASKYAFGALADSYYEYLLKQWLQSPSETKFKDMFLQVMDELPTILRPDPKTVGEKANVPYRLIELAPNGEPLWKMDHLSCFAGGLIVLGLETIPKKDLLQNGRNATWLRIAEGLVDSCHEMTSRSKTGLSSENVLVLPLPPFQMDTPEPGSRYSFLRPETAESLYYMYRLTKNEKYRQWGADLFKAIDEHAKVPAGFCSVADVTITPTVKHDEMQSFVMAETFKYLFLLFSPVDTLDLRRYVLNTEGHPLYRGEL